MASNEQPRRYRALGPAVLLPYLVLAGAFGVIFLAPLFMGDCWYGGAPELCDASNASLLALAALVAVGALYTVIVVIPAQKGKIAPSLALLAALGTGVLSIVIAVAGVDSITVYGSIAEASLARTGPVQRLSGEDFSGADLEGADFARAILNEAIFVDANLNRADFSSARLHEANLTGASLIKSDFNRATITQAKLVAVAAREANFSSSKLNGSDLSGADLREAVFAEADVSGVDFTGANLQKAVLPRDLAGADLTDADLRDAESFFAPEGLEEAIWNGTICPDGINSDDNAGTCAGHFLGLEITTTTFAVTTTLPATTTRPRGVSLDDDQRLHRRRLASARFGARAPRQ